MQIAILNQNLEEKRRGVLKTSEHLLFKTQVRFTPISHKVGDIIQKICLLSEYVNKYFVLNLPL